MYSKKDVHYLFSVEGLVKMIRLMLVLSLGPGFAITVFADDTSAPDESAAEVAAGACQAAEQLIASVSEEQRRQLLFAFSDEEQRENWSNLPTGIFERKGLRWGDLSGTQREAVFALLKATLSESGFQQVVDNMEGDELLRRGEGGRVVFGRDEYYVSILGTPSVDSPWMWQFGGHHLAFNATLIEDQITLAPTLTGGQPIDYKLQGRHVRQVAGEEDKSFELVNALTAEQRESAVLGTRYADMIWGPGKGGSEPREEGISGAKLSGPQQELLLDLIRERISLVREPHASRQMELIRANLNETWFSWYGPLEPGSAATFRIQGPSILMEFSPQRLGNDPTNHIHAMYRDPTNDYGIRWIEQRRHEK